MGRIIGISHRVKKTKAGEARPTLVAIIEDGQTREYKLEEETDELDFVFGRFPTEYRQVMDEETDFSSFIGRQLKRQKPKKEALKRIKEAYDAERAKVTLHRKEGRLSKEEAAKRIEGLKSLFEEAKKGYATKVPTVFEGLRAGDTVAMIMGGSGDYLAYAVHRRLVKLGGGTVLRLRPAILKTSRGSRSKDADHLILAQGAQDSPRHFNVMVERDLPLIEVRLALTARQATMKERLGCEQRIWSRLIGSTFLAANETFSPEKSLKDTYAAAKANDTILQAVVKEEERREAELAKVVNRLPVYRDLFQPIKGVGPRIAAGIIAAIGDVRQFWPDSQALEILREQSATLEETLDLRQLIPIYRNSMTPEVYVEMMRLECEWNQANDSRLPTLRQIMDLHRQRSRLRRQGMRRMKKFCGVHVAEDGGFARHRIGQDCNWSPEARQALYLLADQFNRRPESVWGQKLLWYKARLREKHPEPVLAPAKTEPGKMVKRYTDGHIHKMAIWRTLTKFVEWLYREWSDLATAEEGGGSLPAPPTHGTSLEPEEEMEEVETSPV